MLSILLASLLQWQIQTKNLTQQVTEQKINITQQIQKEENALVGLDIFNRSSINRNVFILGDSVWQVDRRRTEQSAKELASKGSYQRGRSYTSGQAEVIGESSEQCVIYAKRRSGITRTIGYAGYAKTQGTTPQVGSIGIEKGHAVFVEEIDGDKITITESNYYAGKITKRILLASQIRGYIYN